MKLSTASFLLAPLFLARVRSSPWFGTKYIAIVETEVFDGYTETSTIPISPTATKPDVLRTFTSIDSYDSDVTAVNLVVAPTAGAAITGYEYPGNYVNVVYTMPPSCSYEPIQTLTTAIPIYVPYEAKDLIQPESIITSTITYEYITDKDTVTMAMLEPSDIPNSVYASVSSAYADAIYSGCRQYPIGNDGYGSGGSGGTSGTSYTDYSGCSEFTWYIAGSAFSGGSCCADGCHYTWGIPPWGLALAVFFSWFGLFLIIGLVESWFIFRRAMLGQKVRRGLPYGFAFLCPVLSCLFLFTVKKYSSKTPEQQAFLAARWKEMSTSAAMGLWLNNFFRRTDPTATLLGLPPTGPAPVLYHPQWAWYAPQQEHPSQGVHPVPKNVTVNESEGQQLPDHFARADWSRR